jgi:hypothetical protein
MTHQYDWWLTPSVALWIYVLQLEARIEKARWNGRASVFRFPVLFRLALILIVPFFTYLLIRDWKSEDWFIRLAGLILSLCFVLGWPPTILVTSTGVERRLWWKPRIFIPWSEIVDAEINASGDVSVIGLDATIFVSRFQNDPLRFQNEIKAHTKVRRFSTPEQVIGLHL